MSMTPDKIIKTTWVTEKATAQSSELGQYTFVVDRRANRQEVAKAIEALYDDVKVARVNILNKTGKVKRNRVIRGTTGKKADIKKAIVTLKEGTIEMI